MDNNSKYQFITPTPMREGRLLGQTPDPTAPLTDEDIANGLIPFVTNENPSPPNELVPDADALSKEPKEMDDQLFWQSLKVQYDDAKMFYDSEIQPKQARAISYFKGEQFNNIPAGQSSVVMTEFRDSVLATVPSVQRPFVATESVVEFIPSNASTVDVSEQQTAYVNYVIHNDNPGYLIINSTFVDALKVGMGVIKCRWSEDKTIEGSSYSGVTASEIAAYLQSDPTVQMLGAPIEDPMLIQQGIDPTTGQPLPPLQTYSFKTKRVTPKNRLIIESIPPEDFYIQSDATSIESAVFVAHKSRIHISDIVAMGYDIDEIQQYRGSGDDSNSDLVKLTRNPFATVNAASNTPDESMRKVLFIEAYCKIDRDQDGIAEWYKIHAVGDQLHILHNADGSLAAELVSQVPFALFCPLPEPHAVYGQSLLDLTEDLQRIKSNVMRNGLDAYQASVKPRLIAMMQGITHPQDLLNTRIGATIRTNMPNAVTPLITPFDGNSLVGVLNYLDRVKDKRTGVSDASQGLDPNVLQGAATEGVVATISGAQERMEMYCRNFAEMGMRRLATIVARMLREHQDEARTVKLNGKWVDVDPRTWIGDLECVPNVALGKGTDQQRLQFLNAYRQSAEGYIQQAGPTNPLAGADKLSNVWQKMFQLNGFKSTAEFINDITPQQIQAMAQKQAQMPPPPNPALLQAQAMIKQAQDQSALDLAKFHWEQVKDISDEQLKREQIQLDAYVKLEAAYLQHGREVDKAAFDQLIQHQDQVASQNLAKIELMAKAQLDTQQNAVSPMNTNTQPVTFQSGQQQIPHGPLNNGTNAPQ